MLGVGKEEVDPGSRKNPHAGMADQLNLYIEL